LPEFFQAGVFYVHWFLPEIIYSNFDRKNASKIKYIAGSIENTKFNEHIRKRLHSKLGYPNPEAFESRKVA
jgi:hypothetical protein